MVLLLALIGLFLFVTCLILPWVNRGKIDALRERVERLEKELGPVRKAGAASQANVAQTAAQREADYALRSCYTEVPRSEETSHSPEIEPAEQYEEACPVSKTEPEELVEVKDAPPKKKSPTQRREPEAETNWAFEQLFGGRAFVWLGGICLALAGFYLVKYSIEAGILTERVRVVLGILFGIGLLSGGYIVRQSPSINDGARIAQALAGAGIADLYACSFAATSLYHIVPAWLGFTGMAFVTALALILSLRHGAPIATLGLLGGFATPLLIQSGEANTAFLFGYLYLVFCGLITVASRNRWWGVSLLATAASFLWVLICLFNGLTGFEGVTLSLFLIGLCGAVITATSQEPRDEDDFQPLFRGVSLGGAVVLMAVVAHCSNYGLYEMGLFGLLSIGTFFLAWYENETEGWLNWVAMGATAASLLGWHGADPVLFSLTLTWFGLMFASTSYALMQNAKTPASWAGLSAVSALVFYLISFHKMDGTLALSLQNVSWLSSNAVWALVAFVLGILYATATFRAFAPGNNSRSTDAQKSIFALAATSLLSIGFAILLDRDYFVFALTAEVLALGWVDKKVKISSLRPIAQTLTGLFAFLIVPNLFQSGHSFSGESIDVSRDIVSVAFNFGLPSFLFAASSVSFRQKRDDWFVSTLESGSIALFAVAVYKIIWLIASLHGTSLDFTASAVFTNIVLLLSYACLAVANRFARSTVMGAGVALFGLAVLRLIFLHLVGDNPLWSHQMVGSWPLINALALTYGLPALLLASTGKQLAFAKLTGALNLSHILVYVLAFVLISLNVRQFFHGAYLDGSSATNAEVYTYSAVWLAFGIFSLIAGAARQDRMLRVASLVTMLLTVGKVFLYDASELEGLWRVFSFFGLGLCLLGLSWFYSRYVFKDDAARS